MKACKGFLFEVLFARDLSDNIYSLFIISFTLNYLHVALF